MRSWSEKGETSQTKRKRQKESYELKKIILSLSCLQFKGVTFSSNKATSIQLVL